MMTLLISCLIHSFLDMYRIIKNWFFKIRSSPSRFCILILARDYSSFPASDERGKAAAAMSHHYFPFRTTTFDSFRQNYFFKWSVKCGFQKSSRVTQKSTTQTIFSILHKINILCVEFSNCFTIFSR